MDLEKINAAREAKFMNPLPHSSDSGVGSRKSTFSDLLSRDRESGIEVKVQPSLEDRRDNELALASLTCERHLAREINRARGSAAFEKAYIVEPRWCAAAPK